MGEGWLAIGSRYTLLTPRSLLPLPNTCCSLRPVPYDIRQILMVDADPQCNLTQFFTDSDSGPAQIINSRNLRYKGQIASTKDKPQDYPEINLDEPMSVKVRRAEEREHVQ